MTAHPVVQKNRNNFTIIRLQDGKSTMPRTRKMSKEG